MLDLIHYSVDFLSSSFIVSSLLFLSNSETLPNLRYCFSAMSVCFLNSLPNNEYSNFLIVPTFSNGPFSGKVSFPVKNLYFATFPDGKAEILAFCLPKLFELCFTLFCYRLF